MGYLLASVASLLLWGTAAARGGAAVPPLHDLPPKLPCRWGVFGIQVAAIAPDTVLVYALFPRSPALRAGLHPGDRLLGLVPYRLRTPEDVERCLHSLAPGTIAQLVIERAGRQLVVPCRATDVRTLYFLMDEQESAPQVPPPTNSGDELGERLAAAVAEASARARCGSQHRALAQAFSRELQRYGADCRLGVVDAALRHPFAAATPAGAVATDLGNAKTPREVLVAAAHALGLSLPTPTVPGPPTAIMDSLGNRTAATVVRAQELLGQAYAHLPPAASLLLRTHLPLALLDTPRSLGVTSVAATTVALRISALRTAKELRLIPLFAAALALLPDSGPWPTATVCQQQQPHPAPGLASGALYYARQTTAGWILIGGPGPNHYRLKAAAIIDLGGDDIYSAGPRPVTHERPGEQRSAPISLILDLAGNDTYLGDSGAGLGGVSVLIDHQGDDVYCADILAQGAAAGGVSLLWDGSGNDVYLARQGAQGCAMFGAGILVDESGDDVYCAGGLAQGFGATRGLGLLLDRSGDDSYVCDRQVVSAYGTAGVYQSWGQGMGCGIRGFAAGGIGVLLDESGDDRYQAGEFAQGSGYFFGLGILRDSNGTDSYIGHRYAQGTAAHQAVGILLDEQGDDSYRAAGAASQGAGWDAAVGILIDGKGNDEYTSTELSQGAAAMNAVGVLIDLSGCDTYTGKRASAATPYPYWGGRDATNAGFLLDVGTESTSCDIWTRGAYRTTGCESIVTDP